jgi:ectoine hydroxylase-related dioxygenase (phytanoyl-CoA dioxygenase family)
VPFDAAIAHYADALLQQGFCVIPDALPATTLDALQADLAERFAATPFGQGGFYGETTKRFGRLLVRSRHAEALVRHSLVLGVIESVLSKWCECIQLNTTQAIAVHPGAQAQLPHRDQDMWGGPKGEMEYLVNVMWPLDAFTRENGATQVWPVSHGRAALDDEPGCQPHTAEMLPGSALLFLGSTLHAAGANRSQDVRRGIIVGYALGWLKPYENQWLAYPPALAATFTPELAALVGYRQHRPNLGNYEGQCPSVLLNPNQDPDAALGAIDALRDDQQAMVAAATLRFE